MFYLDITESQSSEDSEPHFNSTWQKRGLLHTKSQSPEGSKWCSHVTKANLEILLFLVAIARRL